MKGIVFFSIILLIMVTMLGNSYAFNNRNNESFDNLWGHVWVISIGISDYKYSKFQLDFASKDAQEFSNLMEEKNGVPKDHIFTLLDDEATFDGIRTTILGLTRRVSVVDWVVIYFSGHVTTRIDDNDMDEDDNYDECLLPYDAMPYDLSHYIIDDDLARWIRYLRVAKVILILDSCYGAGMELELNNVVHRDKEKSFKDISYYDLDKLEETSKVVFASSDESQPSKENHALGHGVFTYYLLEALSGRADFNKDGWVSVDEAQIYVGQTLSEKGYSQTPTAIGEELTATYLSGNGTIDNFPDLNNLRYEEDRFLGTSEQSVNYKHKKLKYMDKRWEDAHRKANDIRREMDNEDWQLEEKDDDELNGELRIITTPMDASVYLNDMYVEKTPFTLLAIPYGRYNVTIECSGYRTLWTQIEIGEKCTTINVSLKPK